MQEPAPMSLPPAEVKSTGKEFKLPEKIKAKVKEWTGKGKKLLARLRAKTEDKPREVIEEVAEAPEHQDELVSEEPLETINIPDEEKKDREKSGPSEAVTKTNLVEFDTRNPQQFGELKSEIGFDLSRTEVGSVGQRGIGIAKSSDSRHLVLQTQSLGSCVAITFFSPDKKLGCLIHVDSLTDVGKALGLFKETVGGNGTLPVEATLVGGTTDNDTTHAILNDIVVQLNRPEFLSGLKINLRAAETLGQHHRQVLLDTKTGEVTILYEGGYSPTARRFYEPNDPTSDPFMKRSHINERNIYKDVE